MKGEGEEKGMGEGIKMKGNARRGRMEGNEREDGDERK